MDESLTDSLLTEVLRESERAKRRFASWSADLFEERALSLLPAIWEGDPDCGRALLAALSEGVGERLLGPLSLPPVTLLDALMREHLPRWLPAQPKAGRVELLVRLFNLGEGCAKEPPFVDAYLRSRISALRGPETLVEDLARELSPLVDDPEDASWRGPYALHVLDLRETDDRFLPGKMALVSPRILAVCDRRRPLALSILLGPGAPSVLGPIDVDTPTQQMPGSARPEIAFGSDSVSISGVAVALPLLQSPHTHVVSRAGYLAASAENSQRLWVVCHG